MPARRKCGGSSQAGHLYRLVSHTMRSASRPPCTKCLLVLCYFSEGLFSKTLVRLNVSFFDEQPGDERMAELCEAVKRDLLVPISPVQGACLARASGA